MDIDTLIKNWHEKDPEDYFSGYVFEYLAFIAYLKRKLYTYENKDRWVIQLLKRETLLKDRYLSLVSNNPDLQNAWQEIKNELDKNQLWNISHNWTSSEEDKWWNCSSVQPSGLTCKGTIRTLDDWENMVEFWYAIRNNLFHGGKDPNDNRDEFLVEHGYTTLKPFVAILIK